MSTVVAMRVARIWFVIDRITARMRWGLTFSAALRKLDIAPDADVFAEAA